tara:strand:+ start:89 stop:292 length:204 start_codon:yes stop_codon:yes gene_type:complete
MSTNWPAKLEKDELVKRVRKDLSDDEIAEFIFSSEELMNSGRFPKSSLHSITRLESLIRKIRHSKGE